MTTNKKLICEIEGCGADITNHGYEYKKKKICQDCFVEITSKPVTWKIKKWLLGDRKGLRALFHWKVQLLIYAALLILLTFIMAIQ